ncbi:DNA sulfur modification protein DndB [Allocatelliglobosispora scoriae]|uniref:DNA sulfur modification protein DndB n=1 Tax=Allocatelliglobosispora scoriae TaxID=643052 RepID=A0A841BYV7_9ACTN|nr:DNA sulfur modification protein DndB [Allocatelliglobosispora scoriae]MBB5871900.1 DNA sulfur modification protein DndB [Allocatelliglobosispora scoriae]
MRETVSDTVLAVRDESDDDQLDSDALAGHYEYAFPAIRGLQAGRVFYVSMCPLRLLSKMFVWDDEEMPPELRAQRTLNKGRIPEMVRYIDENPTSYTFSAITASVDASVTFLRAPSTDKASGLGTLRVPMDGRFIINDGQHRRAAIEQALRANPDLGKESIAVVFFLDKGLERCQQMFADLNRHAVRPSPSIGVLYDHRDKLSAVTRLVVAQSAVLRGVVESEATSLAKASRKMFTLSAINSAHKALFSGNNDMAQADMVSKALALWEAADPQFPEWALIRDRQVRAQEIRRDFIHTHGIVLTALGRIGNTLLTEGAAVKTWRKRLSGLSRVDWARTNKIWEGRALVGGTVQKSGSNILLTTALIRTQLGMALPAEEQRAEDNRKAIV